jgi:threonine synthase
VGCEPASAASVAGVRALVARGVIGAHEQVVAVLTGHLLKDPDAVLKIHESDGPVRVLAPGDVLRELERALAAR